MFGSTTGEKSGMASALEKDDEATSKGAKAKEDAWIMEPHAPMTAHREHIKGDVPPMKPIKPTYQRMLCPIVWHISHPHHRGRCWIAHPTCLCVVRTYNFRHVEPYNWRYFTSRDPQPYGVSRLSRMPFKGWRIQIGWGLGPVRHLSPGNNHMDWPQSQDVLHHAHPTRCQRRS